MTLEAPKTEELTEDKPGIKSSGDPTPGNGNVLCSCPLNREVVRGAEIYLKWLPTHRTVSTMVSPGIWISNYRDVTLCVCRAPEQSFRGRCCALDVDGRVITVLMETYAGTVKPQKNGNGSCTEKTRKNKNYVRPTEQDIALAFPQKRSSEKTGNGSLSQGKWDRARTEFLKKNPRNDHKDDTDRQ